MKQILTVLASILLGIIIIVFISWAKGNTITFVYEEQYKLKSIDVKKDNVEGLEINTKNFKPSYNYYKVITLSKTITPSSFPCFFKTEVDTLDVSLDYGL